MAKPRKKVVVYGKFRINGPEFCWRLPENWNRRIIIYRGDLILVQSKENTAIAFVTKTTLEKEYPRPDMKCVLKKIKGHLSQEELNRREEEVVLKFHKREERRKRILEAYGIERNITPQEKIYIDGYIHKWFNGLQWQEPIVMAAIRKSMSRKGYMDCEDTHKLLTRWKRFHIDLGVNDKRQLDKEIEEWEKQLAQEETNNE